MKPAPNCEIVKTRKNGNEMIVATPKNKSITYYAVYGFPKQKTTATTKQYNVQ